MNAYPLPFAACPEDAGVSSSGLMKFLDEMEKSGLEFHGLLVLRHGKVAYEMAIAPYDTQTPHMLYSLSKSFTATAVAFAQSEGLLDINTPVLDIFPDKAPQNPSAWQKQYTVRDLLRMGSGLDEQSDSPPDDHKEDWVKHVLSFPCKHEPGTHFHYNTFGTFVCSAIVQKVTGQTVRDYLMPRLFKPLGIKKPEWDTNPDGICTGGFGLHLRTRDIALYGQLLLQNGVWQGKRLLPEGFVDTFCVKQIDNGTDPDNDWNQGYGYQFWRCKHNRFRGDGMFGQVCMVDQNLDMCVAVTAGIPDMGREMNLLHDFVFTAATNEQPDEKTVAALKARTAALCYPWPQGDGDAAPFIGRYRRDDGMLLSIDVKDDVLHVRYHGVPNKVPPLYITALRGTPLQKTTSIDNHGARREKMLTAYGVIDGKLTIVCRLPGAPMMRSDVLALDGDLLIDDAKSVGTDNGRVVYHRV